MAYGAMGRSGSLPRELNFLKDMTTSLTLILKDRHSLTSRLFAELQANDQQEPRCGAFPSEQKQSVVPHRPRQ